MIKVTKRTYQFMKKHSKPTFGSALIIPRKSSVYLFKPIRARPAAAFWGDSDGDGIINGLDCSPNNARLQGKIHKLTPEQREYNKRMEEAERKAIQKERDDEEDMEARGLSKKDFFE